jgi:hypothetical protein
MLRATDSRGSSPDSAHDGRDETTLERLDRNGDELLQQLRVVQTGPASRPAPEVR